MKMKETLFPLLLSRDFWRGCDFQGLGGKENALDFTKTSTPLV